MMDNLWSDIPLKYLKAYKDVTSWYASELKESIGKNIKQTQKRRKCNKNKKTHRR